MRNWIGEVTSSQEWEYRPGQKKRKTFAQLNRNNISFRIFPVAQTVKNLTAMQNPWIWKILWRREWQSTLVFLPGESHWHRSLTGYSPWGCKELTRFSDSTTIITGESNVFFLIFLDFLNRLTILISSKVFTNFQFSSTFYKEVTMAFLIAQLVKNSPNAGDPGSTPGLGRFPWRRERLPAPVFWCGELHGLYSPWGHKESDTTERLSLSFTSWQCW